MTRFLALSRFALPGLAAALLVGLVLELALADGVDDRAPLIVLGAVGGLGLLLVPRQPFVGPLVATLSMAACSAVDPVGFEDLTTPFFVILLSAWCFGAYNQPRAAVLGLTVVLGTALFVVLRFEDGSVTDVPWIFGFVLAAWLAGFAVYQWLAPTGPGWWVDLVERLHPPAWAIGATVPSFAVAFALALAVEGLGRVRAPSPA